MTSGLVLFDRKIFRSMLEWKEKYAPHYALFLKGARGVGKTTLAQKLGQEAYKSSILIRLSEVEDAIKDLFKDSLRDLDYLFTTLQFYYQTPLYERESLIILDDVQHFPLARQALKTLLEDGRYDYVETGSPAAITKHRQVTLIPSEEYTLDVLPMDYEEFLWAQGDRLTVPIIGEHYEKRKPLKTLHRPIMQSFREYMMVGGMPQAVKAFVDTTDFEFVDSVKQQILQRYDLEMQTQTVANAEYITQFFTRIPSELSKPDKRYIISHIHPNAWLREYLRPIHWLDEAMVVQIANELEMPPIGFHSAMSSPSFKCFLMDTGLLISLVGKDRPYLENELYKAILLDRPQVNEGMLIENLVAQCLRANRHQIFFILHATHKPER